MNNVKQTSSKKRVGGSSKRKCARFVVNTNGTVLDTRTNLTWQQEIPGRTFNWKQAKKYVSQLNLGGYNDWKLPTREELQSLVDFTRAKPAINLDCFPATPSEAFWSSSPLADNSYYAWCVYFSYGSSGNDSIDSSIRVRCVR